MKKIFLSMTMVLFGLALLAQPGRSHQNAEERIEAMRVAFITDKLRLTPQESQEFWPVYNQYRDKLETMRTNFRKDHTDLMDMSEAEARQFIQKRLDLEQKELNLKRSYFKQLEGIIAMRKIAMLGKVERDFKARLLEQIRSRRAPRQKRFDN